MGIRHTLMGYAEIIDAFRVVPRVLVALYGMMVLKLIVWYRNMEPVDKLECDNTILNTLIDTGISPERAMELACVVVDVVGGPTTEQTAFATAIIGLSTAIFGFYVNSGRKWESSFGYRNSNPNIEPNQNTNNHKPSL